MQFGVTPCQEAGRYADSLEQVQAAESLGFDSVWLYEHHLVPHHYFPLLIGLAGFATVTRRIRLGTGILALPLHQLVRVAEDVALLDEMSGGRLELGVGLGYRKEEFDALGVPYEGRGGRLREGLPLLVRLLSGERVTHRGRHYQLDDVGLGNLPVQRPHPPLWVAGWTGAALQRAARWGQGWIAGLTADDRKLAECVQTYRHELAKSHPDRPVDRAQVALERETFVADNPEDLQAAQEHLFAMYQREHIRWHHANLADSAPVFEELRQSRFLLGTPEEVAAEIRRYREELGVTHLICRFHFQGMEQRRVLNAMQLFAERVIPTLRTEKAG